MKLKTSIDFPSDFRGFSLGTPEWLLGLRAAGLDC
jgi:hypothetical protein